MKNKWKNEKHWSVLPLFIWFQVFFGLLNHYSNFNLKILLILIIDMPYVVSTIISIFLLLKLYWFNLEIDFIGCILLWCQLFCTRNTTCHCPSYPLCVVGWLRRKPDSDLDGVGSISAIPYARNFPSLLCPEWFDEATLPVTAPICS